LIYISIILLPGVIAAVCDTSFFPDEIPGR